MAALALAGCAGSEGYVDGLWDNGDPIIAPYKADLFDEEGEATCTSPLVAEGYESRARAYSQFGGIINLFIYESLNDPADPNAPEVDAITVTRQRDVERRRRELTQDPLEAMYQYTHPEFDAKYGISGPEDMESIRQDVKEHLSFIKDPIHQNAPIYEFIKAGREWLEFENGDFYTISMISDVQGYLTDNRIDHEFLGLQYEYRRAISRDGEEFLMVTDRETRVAELMRTGETIPLDEDSRRYQIYSVHGSLNLLEDEVYAQFTVVNDQCPLYFGRPAARFWILDYVQLDVVEREPVSLL